MGLRYRKVVSITPWLRVNISTQGLSVSVGRKGRSVGRKGRSVNFNKDGRIVDLTLPGGFRLQKWLSK